MTEFPDLRLMRIHLNNGTGPMPAIGFGILIPDSAETITATRNALEAGFRRFDRAERNGMCPRPVSKFREEATARHALTFDPSLAAASEASFLFRLRPFFWKRTCNYPYSPEMPDTEE